MSRLRCDGSPLLFTAIWFWLTVTQTVWAGKLTLLAGGDAKLKTPFAIEFDRAGAGYIVELDGHRALTLETNGDVNPICGDGTKGNTGDGGPANKARVNGLHNLAIAPNGDIYLADTWNNCVRKIEASTGIISRFAGTGTKGFSGDDGPATKAEFGGVYCVCLNPAGNKLFLADLDNRRVRAIDLGTGIVTTIAGTGEKGIPDDGARATEAPLFDPRAVAVDSKGTVYVLERGGHALRRIDPSTGTITTVVGASGKAGLSGDGGNAKSARMNGPKHIAVDRNGNVLIADAENHVVRMYRPSDGTIVRIAGTGKAGDAGLNGPAEEAQLNRPHGVCPRPDGSIVIADSYNHRIVKVIP